MPLEQAKRLAEEHNYNMNAVAQALQNQMDQENKVMQLFQECPQIDDLDQAKTLLMQNGWDIQRVK